MFLTEHHGLLLLHRHVTPRRSARNAHGQIQSFRERAGHHRGELSRQIRQFDQQAQRADGVLPKFGGQLPLHSVIAICNSDGFDLTVR